MADPVFANSQQVSGKSMNGKSICEFPDVCFTPPQTPATPPGVPLPYPNTAMASDTTDGSTSVKMGGEQIMLKNRSSFKQSTGDEAGSAPNKGMMTGSNRGKAYFIAWSMDVLIEGENAVRNLDLTTHNHASVGSTGAAPVPHVAATQLKAFKDCDKDADKVDQACGKDGKPPCPGTLATSIRTRSGQIKKAFKPATKQSADNFRPQSEQGREATKVAESDDGACTRALRCLLRPYSKGENPDGVSRCCPGQTGHHIPPWSTTKSIGNPPFSQGAALCVCLEGSNHSVGSHGKHHHGINFLLEQLSEAKKLFVKAKTGDTTTFSAPMEEHVKVAAAVTEAQNDCKKECIEQQLRQKFGEDALKKNATHDASHTGGLQHGLVDSADRAALNSAAGLPPPV
ncbi:hypothetical protein AWB74_00403 [Caballeronia arvi]|uniref:Tox-GHH2 domain-containing protein n=1 Tax=Caballeronia arvi TaxID=1777135 RepID=A0A158F548_9BURK|nr:PAAR-like domain-containing protein [Caballeronia arvi]SAL14861.1 hypothetical protein AWB74_00403 [Caballeronia arvi]